MFGNVYVKIRNVKHFVLVKNYLLTVQVPKKQGEKVAKHIVNVRKTETFDFFLFLIK